MQHLISCQKYYYMLITFTKKIKIKTQSVYRAFSSHARII